MLQCIVMGPNGAYGSYGGTLFGHNADREMTD